MPRPYWDPDTEEAAFTFELAVPLLEEAAGGHVEGIVGESDPFEAARHLLQRERFDEEIVSAPSYEVVDLGAGCSRAVDSPPRFMAGVPAYAYN